MAKLDRVDWILIVLGLLCALVIIALFVWSCYVILTQSSYGDVFHVR